MGDVKRCYYCGAFATSVDHVVPQHLLKRAASAELNLARVMRINLWEVPSCRECNSLIGGAVFRDLPARVKYLKGRLRKRYAKILRMPRWTEEELRELGPELQRYVRMCTLARQAIQERVSWRPARFADDFSAVYDLFRRIAAADASKSPTGGEGSAERLVDEISGHDPDDE